MQSDNMNDTLNLRWNNKFAILDANLIKNIFYPPNCIDATPGGMMFWREVYIKNKAIQITLFDSDSNNVIFEVKGISKLKKQDSDYLGYNYLRNGPNSCILRGDGFQDVVGIFILVLLLESGMSMFKATQIYNQIKMLHVEELEKSLKVTVETEERQRETPVKQDIPKIDQESNPVNATPPKPVREMIVTETSTLPTLVGSHPMSTLVTLVSLNNNIKEIRSEIENSVRTPEGLPVNLNY